MNNKELSTETKKVLVGEVLTENKIESRKKLREKMKKRGCSIHGWSGVISECRFCKK